MQAGWQRQKCRVGSVLSIYLEMGFTPPGDPINALAEHITAEVSQEEQFNKWHVLCCALAKL